MIRAAALSVLLSACGGSPEYTIALVLPAGADLADAVRVEVNVIREGCDMVPANGGAIPPSEIVRPLGWHMDEEITDVGDLVPARYGFAARFLRDDCTATYAGCDEQEIEEDGEGSISIALAPADGAACLPVATCLGDDGCSLPEG